MTAGRETQEAGTVKLRAALLADLEEYADEAVDAGHFPNPIGHSFAGCTICRIARAARDILEAADCLARSLAVSSPCCHSDHGCCISCEERAEEIERDNPHCPGMGMDDLCTWPDVDGCGLCRG